MMNKKDILKLLVGIKSEHSHQYPVNVELSKDIGDICGIDTLEKRQAAKTKNGRIQTGNCFADAAMVARYLFDKKQGIPVEPESAKYCIGWALINVADTWLIVEHAWVLANVQPIVNWNIIDTTWYTSKDDMNQHIYIPTSIIAADKLIIENNGQVDMMASHIKPEVHIEWVKYHHKLNRILWEKILAK